MKTTVTQYFTSYSPDSLSIADKAAIYKGFLEKKQRRQSNNWIRIYKSMAYSISTLVVVSTILFWNFFWLFEHKPTEIGQFVVAQAIGKILESQGTFTIFNKDNRTIAGDTIELSDRVVVGESSHVNILVQDSFVAQVFGPAQFEIILNDDNSGYNLKFINGGDNIAINSVTQTDKNISIQTSDGVLIKNNDSSQNLSFSVQKKPGASERSIINQSNSSLEVSRSENKEQQKVFVQPKHSLNFVKDWNQDIQIISQTEILDTPVIVSTTPKNTNKPINQDIDIEIPHTITNDDIKTIKLALEKSFLNSEYNDLIVNYLVGKDNEYKTTLSNIGKRLDRIAPIANIDKQIVTSLTQAEQYAYNIIQWLQTYGVNPEIYYNITVMINKINELPHHEYGFLKKTNEHKPVNFEFIKTIVPLQKSEWYIYK